MRKGFTIIELLVAVVIGGLLLGGALAAYRGLSARQSVKQAGISFITDLKSYQQKALAGDKPLECVNDVLEGYQVSYVDSEHYSVKAVCGAAQTVTTTQTLSFEVAFGAQFNPAQIFFPVLQEEVSGAQTITLTKDTYNYQAEIEPSGVIRGQPL